MSRRRAFTLVELIIVIAIIAILSVSAFMVLTKWIGKSRDSRRLSDIGTIERALSTYQADYDQNPTASLPVAGTTGVEVESGSKSGTAVQYTDFDRDYFDTLTNNGFDVLQKVIKDPSGDHTYKLGIQNSSQKKFSVAATLEKGNQALEAAVRGSFGPGQEVPLMSGGQVDTVALQSLVPHKDADLTTTIATGDFVENEGNQLPYELTTTQ